MAHFYGIVRGGRGEASRIGSKNGGLSAVAASWSGAVNVELSHRNGTDWAVVRLVPWQGKGTTETIYDGPVAGVPVTRNDAP